MRCPVAFAAMSESTTSAGSAEHPLELIGRAWIEKIELDELDAGHRRHVEEVDRHDFPTHLAALALRGADALGCDLAPAAGRGAEIDHPRALPEQMVLVVDLDQLEGSATAKALAPGARDIGIVELPLEPELRRQRTALAGLDPDLERARVAIGAHEGLPAN